MPREQLRALAADVDRLLVAGAGSVPGDEGLRRREQALRDLGKKVPALAKVAEVVGRAVAADIAGAPRALLDLLLVVGRVRAGLATAGVEGPLGPAGPSGPWATPGPAPDLYPIAAVLTRKGSGRIEALKEAASRGDLGDLRLVDALLAGLDDPSPEFADAVAAEALPKLGPAALPELRRGLDLRGKAADARRLTALAAIDPGAGLDLCRRAIEEGSAAIKVRALEVLAAADPEEGATIALGLLAPLATADASAAEPDTPPAKGKRPAGSAPRVRLDKKVRDAAMACLGRSCRDEALEVAMAALLEINGAEVYGHRAAHQILATIPHAQATPRLLHELGRMVVEARAVRPDHHPLRPRLARSDPAGLVAEALGGHADVPDLLRGEGIQDRQAVGSGPPPGQVGQRVGDGQVLRRDALDAEPRPGHRRPVGPLHADLRPGRRPEDDPDRLLGPGHPPGEPPERDAMPRGVGPEGRDEVRVRRGEPGRPVAVEPTRLVRRPPRHHRRLARRRAGQQQRGPGHRRAVLRDDRARQGCRRPRHQQRQRGDRGTDHRPILPRVRTGSAPGAGAAVPASSPPNLNCGLHLLRFS